jgi:hypothetical protein
MNAVATSTFGSIDSIDGACRSIRSMARVDRLDRWRDQRPRPGSAQTLEI